jgi:hypothetical protein
MTVIGSSLTSMLSKLKRLQMKPPFTILMSCIDKWKARKTFLASQIMVLSKFGLITWQRLSDWSKLSTSHSLTFDLWKTSMRFFICILLFLVSAGMAEAAPKKNWYLRIDNGAGGEAFVFKSKAACEAEGKRRLKAQRYSDQMSKGYEAKYRWSNPRCLDRLPYGYLPP